MSENGLKFEEFAYTTQSIRMVEIEGEPWFIVKDVCDILGVKNYKNVMARLRENEKKVINVHAVDLNQKKRGSPKLTLVNEPGLYRTIFSFEPRNIRGKSEEEVKARIEQLDKFKDWVYYEVLPSIRKTGQYIDTEKKFDKFCPVKFDRAGCFEIARKKVHELGLNSKNANLLWRQWYIDFSKEIGANIDTKAKRENISKIEWLEKHRHMEKFCEFISK
jgi:prophage antirepressor-like protein